MAKIKFDHTSFENPAFITRMREITTAMTGNAFFTAIAAKVVDLDTAVDLLETKNVDYNATVQLAGEQLTERDTLREAAEISARALASGSEGETIEAAELQSGGWHLRDAPTPIGPMPAPQNLTASGGDMEGDVDLQWEPIYGRDVYLGECSETPTGPWMQFYAGNKSSCTSSSMDSGELYYFRIRAVGPLGPGPWSDIAQKRPT